MGSKFFWSSAVLLAASIVSSGCTHTNVWPTSNLPSLSSDRSQASSQGEKKVSFSNPMTDGKLATARLAEKRGHSERATQIYLELVKENPGHPLVYHRLGVIAASEGRFEKAHDYFTQSRKLRPNEPKLLSDIGYTYYLQHRLDESEALFRKALIIKPNHVSATNNLAMVLGEQGRFKESLALFKKVNDKADAHSNMAYVYTQMGQLNKAEQEYSKALSLNPDLRSSARAMIQVASKRKEIEHYQALAVAKQKTKAKAEAADSEELESETALAEERPERKPAISRKSIARSQAKRKLRELEAEHASLVSAIEDIDEDSEEADELEEVMPAKPRQSVAQTSDANRAWAMLARSMGSGSTHSRKRASATRSRELRQPSIQQASGSEPVQEGAVETDEVSESDKIQLTSFREDNAPAPPSDLKPADKEPSSRPNSETQPQDLRRPVPANELRAGPHPIEVLRSSDPSESSGLPSARLRRADEVSSSVKDRLSLNSQGGQSASRLNQLRIK